MKENKEKIKSIVYVRPCRIISEDIIRHVDEAEKLEVHGLVASAWRTYDQSENF